MTEIHLLLLLSLSLCCFYSWFETSHKGKWYLFPRKSRDLMQLFAFETIGHARPPHWEAEYKLKIRKEALGATQPAKASFPTTQTNFDPSDFTPVHIQSEIKTQLRLNTLTHCTSVSDVRFRGGNGTLFLPYSQIVYSFGPKENRK